MDMKTYEYRFNVDGKPGGSVIVEARDSMMAKRLAMAQIQGRAGFAGKRITLTGFKILR